MGAFIRPGPLSREETLARLDSKQSFIWRRRRHPLEKSHSSSFPPPQLSATPLLPLYPSTFSSPRFTTPPSTSTATRTEDQVMGGLATTMEGSQHFPRPPPMELPPDVDQLFGPVTKTGTDYLPAETLARAEKGSFMEKVGYNIGLGSSLQGVWGGMGRRSYSLGWGSASYHPLLWKQEIFDTIPMRLTPAADRSN